jgi:hypothetical protein
MRWIIVILWSIMPCYVALMTNDVDGGFGMSIIWTLASLLLIGLTADDDEYRQMGKLWVIIHIIGIMVMVWHFNQP